jgi:hypothetical protein
VHNNHVPKRQETEQTRHASRTPHARRDRAGQATGVDHQLRISQATCGRLGCCQLTAACFSSFPAQRAHSVPRTRAATRVECRPLVPGAHPQQDRGWHSSAVPAPAQRRAPRQAACGPLNLRGHTTRGSRITGDDPSAESCSPLGGNCDDRETQPEARRAHVAPGSMPANRPRLPAARGPAWPGAAIRRLGSGCQAGHGSC